MGNRFSPFETRTMSRLARRLISKNIEAYARGEDASSLDLGNCGLSDLEQQVPGLSECMWLEKLNLGPSYFEEYSRYKNSKNQGEKNQIRNLALLQTLPSLSKLYVSENNIKDLSPLRSLTSLTELGLSENQISNISPLQYLVSLNRLHLYKNRVTNISPLQFLHSLSMLNLSNNRIYDISPLESLTSLRILFLAYNGISDLSPLHSLKALGSIKLDYNLVSDLTPLLNLTSLSALLLEGNKISDLSPLTGIMKYNDIILKISNNPLTNPPLEIAEKGREAILEYFDQKAKLGTEKHYEAKMLIIGEGGAGKSSLITKLIDPSASLPAEDDTTQGVKIHHLDYPLPDGKNLRVNVWDFGGQEIYHATHQFFLTHRSLYILLDDTRNSSKNQHDPLFSYWLQTAELFGGDSPLLIVQNEKKGRSKPLDEKGMKSRFGNIRDVFATDLKTCSKDFNKLRDEFIPFYIKQLPIVGEELPRPWVTIRNHLSTLAGEMPYISWERFLTLCADNSLPGEDKALFLSAYLHDIGVFLHFQEHPLLRQIVILRNDWATDAVYAVMDAERVKESHGRFTLEDVKEIWQQSRWAGKFPELIALMEKFELCYLLPDAGRSEWLVPQLLQPGEPDVPWDTTSNLVLEYEYSFMPRGLLSRLLVRLHRFLREPGLARQSGAILERDQATARVVEAWEEKKIRIHVRGPHRKELITIIADEMERITSPFTNLRITKWVPCNCGQCTASGAPRLFDYQDLRTRLQRRQETVECSRSYLHVRVFDLLEEVFVSETKGLPGPEKPEDKTRPLKVFISYSKKDLAHQEKLRTALSSLVRRDMIQLWWDRQLLGGDEWDERILTELQKSDLILFLISPDFIATDYIWDKEIPLAMTLHDRNTASVVPIVLRPANWEKLDFARLNALPNKGTPVTTYPDQDLAYKEIADQLERIILNRKTWKGYTN